MEDSSRTGKTIRLPIVIPVLPYLKDHHFEANTILPAVEILQLLARSVQSLRPDASVKCMRSASFDRFLQIHKDSRVIDAFNEMEIYENGRVSSRLITVSRIRESMTRTKIHAVVHFTAAEEHISGLPMDIPQEPEDSFYRISSRKLYSDLVPFGPSFQNVQGNVFLSEKGATAWVHAAEHPALSEPLGSPFPFDGALHIACAWGQRFHHIVVFPVGFKKRLIINATVPGENYFCRVVPISIIGESLLFDIWIHDSEGVLREEIRGVIMRDFSGGRVKPPGWVLHRPA